MAPLNTAKRIVVKIGSALLVDAETGELRLKWLKGLAKDIAAQKQAGRDILVVSSGSIALGRKVLGMPDGILTLEQSQAAAAVGQIRLARAYEEILEPYNIKTAQILLTLDDSTDRRRYLNSRATFTALLACDVVPIVNENDTVATDEIRFGDNDRLAAQVASMAGADVLVLLSDVDGFYTGNPKTDAEAKRIDVIENITPELEAMAGDAGTANAKGGMKTKVMAAKTAMQSGCSMAIMLGDVDQPLLALENGGICSWFMAHGDPQAARKQWIATMKPKGTLIVDAGAAKALKAGKSLLPAGVVGGQGGFLRGDMVSIIDENNAELAKGLVNYDAAEVNKISGRQTTEIKEILGYPGRASLVHRDDMVM
ncbi:glutamate 5-kinase [Amylibacter sp. SFDW26]|uniref:glutamate 5-kinase n=1 Tax=Amylibacter sp. SFDW26 TaxID=2652722 RepID=UPI0012623DB1|nr:glutamate 5-kinase [Amylibacter sp. SFDW26]KAB7615604.1 glutamate 5-kinase [Amylibacter sp. SFDW26]